MSMISSRHRVVAASTSLSTIAIQAMLLATLGMASAASAQDGQAGRSILYQDQLSDYDHLTTLPEKTATAADRCAELLRRVDELKGRPQQRSTVMQRYQAECQRDGQLP